VGVLAETLAGGPREVEVYVNNMFSRHEKGLERQGSRGQYLERAKAGLEVSRQRVFDVLNSEQKRISGAQAERIKLVVEAGLRHLYFDGPPIPMTIVDAVLKMPYMPVFDENNIFSF